MLKYLLRYIIACLVFIDFPLRVCWPLRWLHRFIKMGEWEKNTFSSLPPHRKAILKRWTWNAVLFWFFKNVFITYNYCILWDCNAYYLQYQKGVLIIKLWIELFRKHDFFRYKIIYFSAFLLLFLPQICTFAHIVLIYSGNQKSKLTLV